MHGEDLEDVCTTCVVVVCLFLRTALKHDTMLCMQGKDLSDAELQDIIARHDLDHNGVFDEVL